MSGLYIHIPFCKQKCNYCDFHFSVSLRSKEALLEAIKKELVLRKDELKEPIQTIYFGGGTPSLLNISELQDLFKVIHKNYIIDENAEITLEANPDDLSSSYLNVIKKIGVNRLSVGVQSFFDEDLLFMNRSHTSEQSIRAIKEAQSIGFKNITIDLIYGIPGLTPEKWQKNLTIFLELKIPHLSSYALTVEPKTALAHQIKTKKIKALDEKQAKVHFDYLVKFMKQHNYLHYELSNFAKKGFLSKHNTSYWQGKPYLGIGPSAHSYNTSERSWNIANNARYIKSLNKGSLPYQIEELTPSMRYNEYIMTGLRTMWGIDMDKIKHDFDEKYYSYFNKAIQTHLSKNTLQLIENSRVVVAPESLFLVDGIIADLFWVGLDTI
ncbi:MAG: radical SAM family heme chaperone HemW [Bacteroidota bacterium]